MSDTSTHPTRPTWSPQWRVPERDIEKSSETASLLPVWPVNLEKMHERFMKIMKPRMSEDELAKAANKLWKESVDEVIKPTLETEHHTKIGSEADNTQGGESTESEQAQLELVWNDIVLEWKRLHFSTPILNPEEELKRLVEVLKDEPWTAEREDDDFIPDAATFPPVPAQARDHDVPYMLGWANCDLDAWLAVFMQAINIVHGEPNKPVIRRGLQELKDRSDYEYIYSLFGVRADTMLWHDDFAGMLFERLPIADMLVIACTRDQFYYYRRPSASQYAWLKRVLGEPKWYRYTWSRKQFDADEFLI